MFVSAFSPLPTASQSVRVCLLLAGFVLFVCLSGGVSIASGQKHKALPQEELETYGDAPATSYQTGVSPGMQSTFDVFTSHQVNVNASGLNITGDAANEPSIAVDPTNRSKMVIGWRQFNSVTSNFRQSGVGYTADGGSSWIFPGVLENNVFRSDPVLFADDTGRFYYNSLLQTFFDNIWRSLDSGHTWTNLQGTGNATGGDKQWYMIDNTSSTGHGFHYQAWSTAGNNFGGRQFSRSTDGGITWQNPVNIPNSPQWGTLDVDTTGNLFVGGVNINSGQVWCVRSTNAKNGAVTPSFDQSAAVDLGGDVSASDVINPAGLTGQIFLAVDRSGTGTNNNIYMLASVIPTGFTTGSDVMFVRSTNGGQTFSTPVRINDDPVNHSKWHWMSTFSVAPNGRIDALWLDTRNAANNTDSQLFYSYSTDAGVTWSANVQVSNSFNPLIGYPQQNKMGDYMTIISDNTGGDVAYAATFNSEEDIYYVRVAPVGGPSPTPTNTPVATPSDDPTPTATATPPAPAISGTVTYGNASGAPTPRFVSSVLISGAGNVPVSIITNNFGQYSLSGFGVSSYTVTPSKTGSVNGAITSFDAARIAQHAAGVPPLLTGNQLVVADVSGNGTVSSFDSGEVAKYVVGTPPFGSTGNWIFSPVSRTYPSITTNIPGQDYEALLMGEVSGNWSNIIPRPIDGPERSIAVSAPQLVTPVDNEVIIPVAIQGAANKGIISYEFDLRYDPSVIQPAANSVDLAGTVSRGLSAAANGEEAGLLRVAVYGPKPIGGNGLLLNLRFTAIGAPGSVSPLTWERIMLNEGEPATTAADGQVELSAAAPDQAEISGRLLNSFGQGIPHARITLTDTAGQTRSIISNGFGYYRFGNLQVGQTYTISARSRGWTFTPLTVSVTDELVSFDMIAGQ